MAEADDEIRAGVLRENPRRVGESSEDWQDRLADILARAARIYWNDIAAIREATGTDVASARRLYREAIDFLGKPRRRASRDSLVGAASDIAEAEAKPEEVPGVDVVFDGEEYVFELQVNQEAQWATVDELLPNGSHKYEADVYLLVRGREVARETVTFTATPDTFWAEFHAAARAWVTPVLDPYQVELGKGRYGGSFEVTQIRVAG